MAAVFAFVVAVVGSGLFFGLQGYIRWGRNGRWLRNPYLPMVLVVCIVGSYLVAKIAYEEVYPCVAVDPTSCDFSSTQDHNRLGLGVLAGGRPRVVRE